MTKVTLKIMKAAMERTGQTAANIRSKAMAVTNRKNPKKVTMSRWKTAKQVNLTTYCTVLRIIQTCDIILKKTGVQLVTASFPKVGWRSGRPVHQLRVKLAQNVVKGKPGATSFGQQRVSDENSVVDYFLVFFSPQVLDHIVECTNNEGRRVKQELWTLTNRKELKAFLGLLLLRLRPVGKVEDGRSREGKASVVHQKAGKRSL